MSARSLEVLNGNVMNIESNFIAGEGVTASILPHTDSSHSLTTLSPQTNTYSDVDLTTLCPVDDFPTKTTEFFCAIRMKGVVEFDAYNSLVEDFSADTEVMVDDECIYDDDEDDILGMTEAFPVRAKYIFTSPNIGRPFEFEDIYDSGKRFVFQHWEDTSMYKSPQISNIVYSAVHRKSNTLKPFVCVDFEIQILALQKVRPSHMILDDILDVYDDLLEAYHDRAGVQIYKRLHDILDIYLSKYYNVTGLDLHIEEIDFFRALVARVRPNNQGYLVGVELNPGPNNNDFIIRCCKNFEKLELECASRPKRSNSVPRQLQRLQEKNKTLRKKLRNTKRPFVPEGYFDLGIDADSKEFISNSIDTLKSLMQGGTEVRVDLVTPTLNKLSEVVKLAKDKFGFVYDYFKFIFAIVYRHSADFGKKILAEFASLFFSFNPEGVIDNAFLMILYKDTIGKYLGDYDIIGISRIISRMTDEKKALKSSFNWVFELIKDITVAINTWFHTSIPVLSGDSKLDQYFKTFYEIKKKFEIPGASHYHIAQELYILYEAVERYYREASDRDDKEKVLYLLRLLKPLVHYCESTVNPNNGPRIEPLAVCITGPSGVGKSSFTTPVLLALLARVLPKDRLSEFMTNHNEFLFFRANENEYWDGYRSSHEAIVFDDFGQKKDIPGGDNPDAFEIIRLKNTAPYHLHFASIADKQKNYANPRFLYCTTNRNTLKFNSIVCNEAVTRRFDLSVLQVPKVDYCKDGTVTSNPWERRLDLTKVRKDFPYDPRDPSTYLALDVIEFIDWDFTTGWPLESGRTYTFHEFIDVCKDKYTELNCSGDAMLAYHQFIKKQYSAEGSDGNESEEEFFDCQTLDESLKVLFDRVATPEKVFPENWQIFGSIIAFVSTCFVGTSILKSLFSSVVESDGKVNHNPKTSTRTVVRKGRRSPKAAFGKTKIVKQMKPEANAWDYDLLIKIVRRNFYTMYVNDRRVGNIIFLRGRTCVFPNHYNTLIDACIANTDVAVCTLYDCVGVPQFKFDWFSELNVYNFEFDLQAVTIPGIREHADISECFVSESAVHDGDGFESMLPIIRNDQLVVLEPYVKFGYSTTYMENFKSHRLQYIAATQGGDCGSPLITVDKRFGRPTILGFHTAGQSFSVGRKACLGVFLSREEVSYCLEALDEDLILAEDFECSIGFNMEGFSTLGKAQPPKFASKSKIEPTRIQGKCYEITTMPAKLTPFVNSKGEKIDPGKKAQFKYCTEPVCVDMYILDQASLLVNERVLKHNVPAPWEPRIWTFEEAVSGVDGVEYCNAIDRGTSAGYPHNLNMRNGKKLWLGNEGKVDFDSKAIEPLKKMVDDVVEKAKKGIRASHIYMDCLKDERRSKEKVDAGKTRQFMACPIQFLISVRMYFGDFIRHICANKILNGISVGINPASEEWTTMYNYLHPDQTYVHGAGDYASFDCNLAPQVDYKFLECAELFYSPTSTKEDVTIRRVLFLDIVNSIHIDRNGNLYEFNGKNPSGQPATAVMNSYVNSLMLVSCWIKNGISQDDIRSKFFWNTFGDDHVTGFPKEFEEKAGSLALAKTMKDMFGYEYTDESKTGTIINTKPLSEIQYLKRGFRFNGIGFDAPLDLSVLKETLNWQKSGCDRDTLLLRFDCWYVELARHGKAIFESISKPVTRSVNTEYNYISPFSVYSVACKSDVLFGPNF